MTDIKLTKWVYCDAYKLLPPDITLTDDDGSEILKITRHYDGTITFSEEYDSYLSVNMSKADAILALQEAIAWIEGSHEN